MLKSEITKELVGFLKKEGVYEEYMQFFDEDFVYSEITNEDCLIEFAFNWDDTGVYSYWRNISKKWQLYLQSDRTPFTRSGYNKDTVFKVVSPTSGFLVGDHVLLDYDDGSTSPKFKTTLKNNNEWCNDIDINTGFLVEVDIDHEEQYETIPPAVMIRDNLICPPMKKYHYNKRIDLDIKTKKESEMKQKYVWVNTNGEYMVLTRIQALVGTEIVLKFTNNLKFTTNLNEASVLTSLPDITPHPFDNLMCLPAIEVKQVKLVIKK